MRPNAVGAPRNSGKSTTGLSPPTASISVSVGQTMTPPEVGPTLDYLKALSVAGVKVVDVAAVGVANDRDLMRVYGADGQQYQFQLRADHETFMRHYKEAIEYLGYGPKGLSNLIYAGALDFGRQQGLKNSEVEVLLSQDCVERVGDAVQEYMTYGFTFTVSPSLSGLGYSYRRKEAK